MENKYLPLGLFVGTFGLALLAASTRACEVKITWKAALSGSRLTPPVASPATGTATIDFDLAHPGATVEVDTQNLQDAQAIEMHVTRSFTDRTGPAVFTLYSNTDGPLPATLTKRVTEADLHKQTIPKLALFSDVVSAVLNGRAYVMVLTKAHPKGELSGVIGMHKEEIYSDNATDTTHDPALHHPAPVTPPH